MVSKQESEYQLQLVDRVNNDLRDRGHKYLSEFIVYISDPNYIQGIPDLFVLFKGQVAMLEVKLSEKSKVQPNQEWYINAWGYFTFASFIYPENEKEVLDALYKALRA